MQSIKWIKLTVDMFDDEKIKIIERMPDGDQILIIWIKLLTLAGKRNMNGWVMLTESMPYDDQMLAYVIGRDVDKVKYALDVLDRFDMIEVSRDNAILISNFDKHQSIDKMSAYREKERLRKQKQREKQKLLKQGMDKETAEKAAHQLIYGFDDDQKSVTGQVTGRHAIEEEEEGEEDKDIKNVEDHDPSTSRSGKKKRIYDVDSNEYRLAKRLYDRILVNNPDHKEPDLQKWADVIRLMIDRDKRQPETIAKMIDWVQNDTFWMSNILSAEKLRKQWDKLIMQVKTRGGGGTYERRRTGNGGHHEPPQDYKGDGSWLFAD